MSCEFRCKAPTADSLPDHVLFIRSTTSATAGCSSPNRTAAPARPCKLSSASKPQTPQIPHFPKEAKKCRQSPSDCPAQILSRLLRLRLHLLRCPRPRLRCARAPRALASAYHGEAQGVHDDARDQSESQMHYRRQIGAWPRAAGLGCDGAGGAREERGDGGGRAEDFGGEVLGTEEGEEVKDSGSGGGHRHRCWPMFVRSFLFGTNFVLFSVARRLGEHAPKHRIYLIHGTAWWSVAC